MTILSLGQTLLLFIYPLSVAILAGATAFALSFTRWRRLGQVLLGFALIVLWVAATPIVANWLNWRLESRFPPVMVEALPQSDVVIIAGGILGQPLPPRVAADLSGSADRIIHALRIYRAGKAKLIVISAGSPFLEATLASEAQLIADFLVELGVPRSDLILETESRNTRENATNTAAIFKERDWQSGLLVTSGLHMPRALAAFRRVGLNVTPAATDVHAGPPLFFISPYTFLPDVGALGWTTLAMHEMIGLGYYRLRGWT